MNLKVKHYSQPVQNSFCWQSFSKATKEETYAIQLDDLLTCDPIASCKEYVLSLLLYTILRLIKFKE